MAKVVWRAAEWSEDEDGSEGEFGSGFQGSGSDGSGSEEGFGSFEQQLAAIQGRKELAVQQELDALDEALLKEPESSAGNWDGANGAQESFLRDGVSYAQTTPASVEEWSSVYPFLCVRGRAIPLHKAPSEARHEQEADLEEEEEEIFASNGSSFSETESRIALRAARRAALKANLLLALEKDVAAALRLLGPSPLALA